MKKEYIIPIFVPNLGCPMECTFCSQEKITGKETKCLLYSCRQEPVGGDRKSGKTNGDRNCHYL